MPNPIRTIADDIIIPSSGTEGNTPSHLAITAPDVEQGFFFIQSRWGTGFGESVEGELGSVNVMNAELPALIAALQQRLDQLKEVGKL